MALRHSQGRKLDSRIVVVLSSPCQSYGSSARLLSYPSNKPSIIIFKVSHPDVFIYTYKSITYQPKHKFYYIKCNFRATCLTLSESSSGPLGQCFSTFVRPWPGIFFFHKTRARSQQIYLPKFFF